MSPEEQRVRELAYRLWEERGRAQGSAEQDWYAAERQLDAGAKSRKKRGKRGAAAERGAGAEAGARSEAGAGSAPRYRGKTDGSGKDSNP